MTFGGILGIHAWNDQLWYLFRFRRDVEKILLLESQAAYTRFRLFKLEEVNSSIGSGISSDKSDECIRKTQAWRLFS